MIYILPNIIYYEEIKEKIALFRPESKKFLVQELKHILCKWEQNELTGRKIR